MRTINNATIIKKKLLVNIAKILFNKENPKLLDKIPINMIPKNQNNIRCCIYKDRAVLKYRMMAILGYNCEDEENELKPISEYFNEINMDKSSDENILTIIDVACSSCSPSHYKITENCKGCVARACINSCRKDAISIINSKAVINYDKCVKCGLCMQACPYNAIVYIPVPCEEACPVSAISKDKNGKIKIDFKKCIFCGKCLLACPFGAIMEKSDFVKIINQIIQNKNIVALIAPSIFGQFKATPGQIINAIQKLGFKKIYNVAEGAEITTANEAEELKNVIQHNTFLTNSCCPSYVNLIEKHIPNLKPNLSKTKTPMQYTADIAKNDDKNCITVFIGPCIAKRIEGGKYNNIDYVMSFEELGAMFIATGIDVNECEDISIDINSQKYGVLFPISGGVTTAIKNKLNTKDLSYEIINGLDKKNISLIKIYGNGKKFNKHFLEVMSCKDGCMGGPTTISEPSIGKMFYNKLLK